MMFNRPIVWTPRPNAGFILPGSRFLEVEVPTARVSAAGRYRLIKHRGGTVIQETPWFDNIILDSGLNRWGTGSIIQGAAIGTGTSAPNAGQVGLDTLSHYTTTVGTGNGTVSTAGISPYNNTRTSVYRTTLGALNGNYSEVGVGWASATMFSRALILDGVGAPTTISVGLTEQLDIWYQLSLYPPLVDTGPYNITISGVTYSVTSRACFVNSSNQVWPVGHSQILFNNLGGMSQFASDGPMGLITSGPSGTNSLGVTIANVTYVNNSKEVAGSYSFGLTQGNSTGAGGIKSAVAGTTIGGFQYEFNPIIPKDNTKTLVLNYKQSWARRP